MSVRVRLPRFEASLGLPISDGVVLLDRPTVDDIPAILAGMDAEVRRYFAGRTDAELRWELDPTIWLCRAESRDLRLAVRRVGSPELIGRLSLVGVPDNAVEELVGPGQPVAMDDVWIVPDHRRQGFGDRAVDLELQLAFDRLGYSWTFSLQAKTNVGSSSMGRGLPYVRADLRGAFPSTVEGWLLGADAWRQTRSMPAAAAVTSAVTIDDLRAEDIVALTAILEDSTVRARFSALPTAPVMVERAARARESGARWYDLAIRHEGCLAGVVELIPGRSFLPGGQVSIMLAPAARGRGVAREAVQLATAYAFETVGWRWIYARVDPANTPAARLFEGLGWEPGPPAGPFRTFQAFAY